MLLGNKLLTEWVLTKISHATWHHYASIIDWSLENQFQWMLNQNTTIFIPANEFENVYNMADIMFHNTKLNSYKRNQGSIWRRPNI